MPLSRADRLLLTGLLAFNAVLKLLWMGVNDLAHDEPFTIYWSQRPLPELLAMLAEENNPPLHFLITKGWSLLVPFEAAWLRLPSALANVLTVWPLYLLAYRLGSTRMAVTTTVLFTLSNYHYTFAHEVRAYALFTLLATLGLWLLVRGRDRSNGSIRAMLGLSAVNTVLVYTHFFGWLAIGVQLLVVMLPGFHRLRRGSLIGLALTLACFAPYLRIFLLRAGTSMAQGTWLEPPVPEELYNMVWRWSNAPVLAVSFLGLITFACLRGRPPSEAIRIGMLWCLPPLLGMFLVSQWVPLFLDRYLVYAAPGFALLVAASVEGLRLPERTGHALAAVIMAGMAVTFKPWQPGPRQPGRVVAAVEDHCRQGCELQVTPAWYWLNYLAVSDLGALRADQHTLLNGERSVAQGHAGPSGKDLVVVDASGGLEVSDLAWKDQVWMAGYHATDSVEADHKVWVYRFQR